MKTIVIIAALGRELKKIRSKFAEYNNYEHFGFRVTVTEYKGYRVVLSACSVGKVNAAICTQMMIDKYKPDFIVNVGISGSLQDHLNIGDIIIAEEILYHDLESYILKGSYPYQESFFPDPLLLSKIKRYSETYVPEYPNNSLKLYFGKIITGDSFISCYDKKNLMTKKYNNPLAVEMEGAAIGHTSYINKIPFIVVRGISDAAGQSAREEYEKNEIAAANLAGDFVFSFLEEAFFSK